MVAKFTKPSGAFADVKELEYISALHQTGKNELREDGSIQAIDIVHFLMSRYGIKVTEEEVRERILNSFGNCSRRGDESRKSQIISEEFNEGDAEGGSADSGDECNTGKEEDYIDLTQVLALLLVPLLLKAQRSLKRQRKIEAQQPSLRHLSSSIEDSGTSQMAHSASSDSPFFDKDHHCEKGAKRWPDSDLMENVLQMMLHDATGDPTPRPLTKELIRQILNLTNFHHWLCL